MEEITFLFLCTVVYEHVSSVDVTFTCFYQDRWAKRRKLTIHATRMGIEPNMCMISSIFGEPVNHAPFFMRKKAAQKINFLIWRRFAETSVPGGLKNPWPHLGCFSAKLTTPLATPWKFVGEFHTKIPTKKTVGL